MEKLLISLLVLNVTFIGCTSTSKEYRTFIETYGSDTRIYCLDGNKYKEKFMHDNAKYPQVYLINSQDCK